MDNLAEPTPEEDNVHTRDTIPSPPPPEFCSCCGDTKVGCWSREVEKEATPLELAILQAVVDLQKSGV